MKNVLTIHVPKLKRDLKFHIRPKTTDEKAIMEVVKRNVYLGRDIVIKPGMNIADFGANIGAFAILAAAHGANVYAVEPIAENFKLLERNVKLNKMEDCIHCIKGVVMDETDRTEVEVYLPRRKENKYRASIMTPLKRRKDFETVPAYGFAQFLEDHSIQGIKMDIEGAEEPIFNNEVLPFDDLKFLTFEWHFDFHPSCKKFNALMKNISGSFDDHRVTETKNLKEWNFFPSGKIQRFWKLPTVTAS